MKRRILLLASQETPPVGGGPLFGSRAPGKLRQEIITQKLY